MPLSYFQIQRNVRLLTMNLPIIGAWLSRKAADELIRDGSPEVAHSLAWAAAWGRNKRVMRTVLEVLRQFENQNSRNAVCSMWLQYKKYPSYNCGNFNELFEELEWVATSPASLQVLTACKHRKRDQIAGLGAKIVEPLVEACADSDEVIAEQAKLALFELSNPTAKEALCKHLLEKENAVVRDAVLTLGCEPKDASRRALFYFLTGQWDKYEVLDFDHRQLRAVYDTADAAMRQRIADRLKESGRPHLLSIAVGGDLRSRGGAISEGEADLLIQAVADNRDWPKLWELISEVPFTSSVKAVQELVTNGWEPEKGDDRDTLRELASLVSGGLYVSAHGVEKLLPPAIQRARVRVPGRVNSVALSPVDPIIAIGTGQGKVVLWNYQKAVREKVLSGFEHSIGQLAFTENGSLVCAERSVTNDEACNVYGWTGDKVFLLGSHKGPVTTIKSIGETQVLSAGRDHRVVLWDVDSRQAIRERTMDPELWIRNISVSPDKTLAALLHHGMDLVSLPDMTTLASRTWKNSGVTNNAAFAPDGSGIIAAKWQMSLWKKDRQKLREEKLDENTWLPGGQLELMPNRPVIANAASNGRINFVSWETRSLLVEMNLPNESLTSFNISSDGLMMAVGDSDASMTLWDLRPLELPMLLTRPFSQITPDHVKTISMFVEDGGLPQVVRQSLRFMECIMRHRFRYDVQIDDSPIIQAGDFDIEID